MWSTLWLDDDDDDDDDDGGGDDDDEDGVCDCDDDVDDIDDDDDDDVGDDDNHKIEYKGGIELNGHRGHWILYRRNTRHFRAQNTCNIH